MPKPSARARLRADGPPSYPDDAALVRRLLDGDESAFQGLVEQYHGRLLRLARGFVSDRAGAEEVVQDTWDAAVSPSRFTPSGRWSAPPEEWDEDTPERLLAHRARARLRTAMEQHVQNR